MPIDSVKEWQHPIEIQPSFPGGEDSMYSYLFRMLDYPDKALQNCIEGKVYVSFVVERDGLITNVHTVRGIGGGCDEEAERVVRSMPRWLPGSYKNEPVRVRYTLPMNFRITDKRACHDVEASFVGGKGALRKYISYYLKYPTNVPEPPLRGIVVVSFTVDANGKILHPTINQSLGKAYDKEAIRVVKEMPRWKPALKNGESISSKVLLSIPFD